MKIILHNFKPFTLPVFIALFLLCGCRTAKEPVATSPTVSAGMAEIDITPPLGFRLAGQFYERFATAKHDPLKAKALVLQQGTNKFVLVFCDLVGPSLHVTTNARAIISRQNGIPVANIAITATHTHTGPLFDDLRFDYFHEQSVKQSGQDKDETLNYPNFLIAKLAKVARQADAKVHTAQLETGVATQTNLPFNRRYYLKNGKVATNPGILNPNVIGPAGPVDSAVDILLVKQRGKAVPVGGLTVFAMHADTAGQNEFSADYPFYIEQTLRGYFGSNYISAFGAGTCGDLNHVDPSQKIPYAGYAVSERLGSSIGKTVLADVDHLQFVTQPDLAMSDEILSLPMQSVSPEELQAAKTNVTQLNNRKFDFLTKVKTVRALDLASRPPIYPAEVQVFRLDRDNAIVFLPGEIFVEFGLAIKKASPFKTTFVISISNDRPGYVPTLKAFGEGSYEILNSRWKPGSGEEMVKVAVKLLNELKAHP